MRLKGAIFLLILTLSSCSFDREALIAETSITGWWREASVTTECRDTLQLQDISILLRYHSELLTGDSLRVNIITTTPKNRQIAEQITLPLRHRDSLARRGVELIEVPYRQRVRWQEMGSYKISIFPTQPTDGVEAAGVVIGKSK